MATIHEWLGLGGDPFPLPRVSIITPSMRPDNFSHVLEQYAAQTWGNRELIYVFNGPVDRMPNLERPDVRMIAVPPEHAAGMAMSAALWKRGASSCSGWMTMIFTGSII